MQQIGVCICAEHCVQLLPEQSITTAGLPQIQTVFLIVSQIAGDKENLLDGEL